MNQPCAICGADGQPTRMALVEWREPVGRERFTAVPRCVDRVACRRRVENELGELWPIVEKVR